MVSKTNMQTYMLSFIALLLVCLIGLVIVLIFVYSNYSNKKALPQEQETVIVIPQEQKHNDTRVHPHKLPEYNSTEYQQIGILTSNETDKEPIVLPLFSRRLHNHKERWNYYTATDKNNMMRLPIVFQNMNCEDDIGCREIYDGDKLNIEIYQGREFTATIYKIESPKYFADRY
jgi:hypothetical protein